MLHHHWFEQQLPAKSVVQEVLQLAAATIFPFK